MLKQPFFALELQIISVCLFVLVTFSVKCAGSVRGQFPLPPPHPSLTPPHPHLPQKQNLSLAQPIAFVQALNTLFWRGQQLKNNKTLEKITASSTQTILAESQR